MKKGAIIYHGTNGDFYPNFKERPTFFAKSIDWTLAHSEIHNGTDEDDARIVVLKCTVREDLKLFFPRDSAQRWQVVNSLRDTNLTASKVKEISKALDYFQDGVWKYLEIPEVMSSIEKLGYCGHIAVEDKSFTYCVYKPSKKIQVSGYIAELNIIEYQDIFDN